MYRIHSPPCVKRSTKYCIRVDNKTLFERDAPIDRRYGSLFSIAFAHERTRNSEHEWNAAPEQPKSRWENTNFNISLSYF